MEREGRRQGKGGFAGRRQALFPENALAVIRLLIDWKFVMV
jgi:hypothetical protein